MKATEGLTPWKLKWTLAHIERFWNWYASNPDLAGNYFSKQQGDAIIDEVARYLQLTGVVVDLGAGPGHLVEKLLKRGIPTLAVDSSPTSVALLHNRLRHEPHFLGACVSPPTTVPLDDATADAVFVIETLEHLSDQVSVNILHELRRVTKRGGHVIATTPNEENLGAAEVLCPNCGCVFHGVQHLRSFSADSLSRLMQTAGFTTVVCRATLFSPYPRGLRRLHRLRKTLMKEKLPHLLYIGRRAE